MTTTQFAMLVAIALGAVAVFAGFGAFAIVAALALVGWVVGRVLEGKLDLRSLTGQTTERR